MCKNRTCVTINAALWGRSREKAEFVDAHGVSSLKSKMGFDGRAEERASVTGQYFTIDTINPTELLQRFSAPQRIEYMSLDVEGCELEVLQALDLNYYQIALMTIEHCHIPERQQALRSHLLPLGYAFYERFYDDWYFHPRYLAQIETLNEAFDPETAFRRVVEQFVVV